DGKEETVGDVQGGIAVRVVDGTRERNRLAKRPHAQVTWSLRLDCDEVECHCCRRTERHSAASCSTALGAEVGARCTERPRSARRYRASGDARVDDATGRDGREHEI